MRAPAFWLYEKPNALAFLLSPLGWIWGKVAQARLSKHGARAEIPVICVGNFVAGGAGKTPTAIALARMLVAQGEKPVFLTRGYKSDFASREPLRVDLKRHAARDVGDEPLLLAALAPTIVCTDRAAGARAARAMGASVIVMDDGMQNPSLVKDITLAVVDGATGVGNGLCIPAGPLRASLAAQGFSAILVVGEGAAGRDVAERNANGRPAFSARLKADADVAESLKGKPVVAFAGIGRPEKFFATLEQSGARVVAQRAFADHHQFTPEEIEELKRLASGAAVMPGLVPGIHAGPLNVDGRVEPGHDGGEAVANETLLVTTEKDFVRLPPDMREGIVALPASLVFDDQENLMRWLFAELARVRASR